MFFHKYLLLFTILGFSLTQIPPFGIFPPLGNDVCKVITVSGSGTANGQPDTAVVTIGVSAQSNTSINALGQMNSQARRLLTILNQYNIPTSNIQTSSLTLGPEYNYTNGTQVLLGQKASQTFTVTVRNINNGSVVGSIIDAATNIQNITVSGLTFDINNKTSLFGIANKNAWDDAYSKANELAGLSGVRLGRANKINVLG